MTNGFRQAESVVTRKTMNDNFIRNREGKIIGRMDGHWLRDGTGKLVARYDEWDDRTRDARGRIVGSGEQTLRVLKDGEN